jgi:broad specificity polyphosphatase/5'/3'-nucleotidase SurE
MKDLMIKTEDLKEIILLANEEGIHSQILRGNIKALERFWFDVVVPKIETMSTKLEG